MKFKLIILLIILSNFLYAQTEPRLHPSQIGDYGGGSNAFFLSNGTNGTWNSASSLRGNYLLPTASTNGSTLRYNSGSTLWETNTVLQNDGTQIGIGMAPVSGDILSILGKTRFYSPIKLGGTEGSSGQVMMSTGSTTVPAWTTAGGDIQGSYDNLQIASGVVGAAELSTTGATAENIFKYNGSAWALSTDNAGDYRSQSTTPSTSLTLGTTWRNTNTGVLSIYDGATFKPQNRGYLESTSSPSPVVVTGLEEGAIHHNTSTLKSWILAKKGVPPNSVEVDGSGGTLSTTRTLDNTWSTNQIEQTFQVTTSGLYSEITVVLTITNTSNTDNVYVDIFDGSSNISSGSKNLTGLFSVTNTNTNIIVTMPAVQLNTGTTYYIRVYRDGISHTIRWARSTTSTYSGGVARYQGADQTHDMGFKVSPGTNVLNWFPTENLLTSGLTLSSFSAGNGITYNNSTGVFGLTGQALSFHNASTGIPVVTSSGTVTPRTITASTGISVTNGDGVSGNPTITNTGDTDASNDITNSTSAGGDLTGTYPNPTIANNAITTVKVNDAAITLAKLANLSANTFIGRESTTGVPQQITFGSGFSINSGTLSFAPTPPGSNTQFIFNNSGSYGAASGLTYSSATGLISATLFQPTSVRLKRTTSDNSYLYYEIASGGSNITLPIPTDETAIIIHNSSGSSKTITPSVTTTLQGSSSAFTLADKECIMAVYNSTSTDWRVLFKPASAGGGTNLFTADQTQTAIREHTLLDNTDNVFAFSTTGASDLFSISTTNTNPRVSSSVAFEAPEFLSTISTSLSTPSTFYTLTSTGTQALPDPTNNTAKFIKNTSGGTITIDPAGTTTINGAATYTLNNNQFIIIAFTGTDWTVFSQPNLFFGNQTQGSAVTHTLVDNNAAPLTLLSTGATGLFKLITTDNQERLSLYGKEGLETYALSVPPAVVSGTTINTDGSSKTSSFARLGTAQTYTLNDPTVDGCIMLINNTSGGNVVLDPEGSTTIDGTTTYTLASGEDAIIAYVSGTTNWVVFDNKGSGSGGGYTIIDAGSITSSQNDWNPSGFGATTTDILIQPGGTLVEITGLVPTSASTAQKVTISNTGEYICIFTNQNVNSSANNRFIIKEKIFVLLPGDKIDIYYNTTSNRWIFPKPTPAQACYANSNIFVKDIININNGGTTTLQTTDFSLSTANGGLTSTTNTNSGIPFAYRRFATGSTSNNTGRSLIYIPQTLRIDNTANTVLHFKTDHIVNTLPNSTTNYVYMAGLPSTSTIGLQNNIGFYFVYGTSGDIMATINSINYTFSSANWHLVYSNSSTSITLVDTGVSVSGTNVLEIVKVPGRVIYYIDNTEVGNYTTNIGLSSSLQCLSGISKIGTATATQSYFESYYIQCRYYSNR